MSICTGSSPEVRKLCEALGLPEQLVSFNIAFERERPVVISISYYATQEQVAMLADFSQTFELDRGRVTHETCKLKRKKEKIK